MTAIGLLQIGLCLVVLLALVKPLGQYMALAYDGQVPFVERVLGPVERGIYRLCGIDSQAETSWKTYTVAMLAFNLLGLAVVYALQRLQHLLPLNPQGLPPVPADLAFNTATSFATNTNWQSYGGETTLGYLVPMLGLTVQNFLSAATGMAVLVAMIRGFRGRSAATIGNFWRDLTRGTLYILLPLSLGWAILLASQGVVQTFGRYQSASLIQPAKDANGNTLREQTLARGPAAYQVAIKQLGTNGGGFFNANSAHPFENPTPLSNFLEVLAILLIPAALCYTFGRMIGDTRQGWVLLAAMLVIFVPLVVTVYWTEQAGNPALAALGVRQEPGPDQPGGNMEGKELRFGIGPSALWAAATPAAAHGSVDSMHDSYTPLGGLVAMWLIQLGEVVFGGVGSGLYGMVALALIAVFVAGLMIGRTPEYLGKKIEAFEMKMAILVVLIPVVAVLIGTAVAVAGDWGTCGISNPGPHGFSQVLYAFSSAGNNNGSAFAGLGANTVFYNLALALAMLAGRFGPAVAVLAIAGSLAEKKITPAGPGTLPTHTPLFVMLLVGMVILVGALSFLPALALGPIAEGLMMLE